MPSRSMSASVASASQARVPVVMRIRADLDQPSTALAEHCQWNTDECLRRGFVQALLECALVDAGINQHRHRTDLEQREHQQEELRRGPHHHHHPDAAHDAAFGQPCGDRIAAPIQLAIGQFDLVATAATGAAHCYLIVAFAGQLRENSCDVAGGGHAAIVA